MKDQGLEVDLKLFQETIRKSMNSLLWNPQLSTFRSYQKQSLHFKQQKMQIPKVKHLTFKIFKNHYRRKSGKFQWTRTKFIWPRPLSRIEATTPGQAARKVTNPTLQSFKLDHQLNSKKYSHNFFCLQTCYLKT